MAGVDSGAGAMKGSATAIALIEPRMIGNMGSVLVWRGSMR
jgi:hypothetical protein